jgi:hypothetical protein
MPTLSHALSVAVKEWQWLDDSPFRSVKKPRDGCGRCRVLNDVERARLLQFCRESGAPAPSGVPLGSVPLAAPKTLLAKRNGSALVFTSPYPGGATAGDRQDLVAFVPPRWTGGLSLP